MNSNLFYGCSVHFSKGSMDLCGWNVYCVCVCVHNFLKELMLLENHHLTDKSEVRIILTFIINME
jgi:hypothetical protein